MPEGIPRGADGAGDGDDRQRGRPEGAQRPQQQSQRQAEDQQGKKFQAFGEIRALEVLAAPESASRIWALISTPAMEGFNGLDLKSRNPSTVEPMSTI